MEREKVVEWVQKLMKSAADPGVTEGERDVIQTKVEELMAKYKISIMDATTEEEISHHRVTSEGVTFAVPGVSSWGFTLAWAIAPIFETKALKFTGTKNILFFGFPEDVTTSIYFFRTLQMQIIFALDASGYKTIKQKNSYAQGMVTRVWERMKATYERVREMVPANTKALIVVKEKQVEKFMKSRYKVRKGGNRKSKIDLDAYAKGYRDGKNLDIANRTFKQMRN